MYNNYGGYPQQQYRQPYQQQYRQPMQQMPRKKSVPKPKHYKNAQGQENIFVSGWHKTKYGFITVGCVTTKYTKDGGKGWLSGIRCKVLNQSTGQSTLYWGTMQISTGKVVISEISMVVNPSAANGGYFGTYLKRKR